MAVIDGVMRGVLARGFGPTAAWRAKRREIELGPENFCFHRSLAPGVIVDVGVGATPTFGPWILSRIAQCELVIVDPTPKHQASLERFCAARPHTHLLARAVGAVDGHAEFFEHDHLESGSLRGDHRNLEQARARFSSVAVMSLETLISACAKHGAVQLVKLDIEGAEFDTLRPFDRVAAVLAAVPQWLVEFHPVPQTRESLFSVFRLVRKFEQLGFTSFSPNGVDRLFYRV